jgi:cytochrome b6-f complex iron-sulfur subunit
VLFPESSDSQVPAGVRQPSQGRIRSIFRKLAATLTHAGESPGRQSAIGDRRRFVGFWLSGFLLTNFVMFLRFFFPRVIYEPNTKFTIGLPADFSIGVDTRFTNDHRVWVVRTPDRLFVIFARCTHLGCTPNWMESEQKFKCPCHGSGYDPEGINFEGPAPRPMDRAEVELDPQGEIIVDTSVLFKRERGKPDQFNNEGAYLPV